MRKVSLPMRAVAAFVAFALIHVSFGSQAWARVVGVGAVSAPVGGSAAATVNSSPANSAAASLSLSNAGLTGSFSAPSIAPASRPSPLPVNAAVIASVFASQPAASPSIGPVRPAVPDPTALTPAAVAIAASKDETPKIGVVPAASETGPTIDHSNFFHTGRIARKAAAIISGVRAFFSGKSIESVPSALDAVALSASPSTAPHASDLEPSTRKQPVLLPPSGAEPPAPPSAPKGPDGGGTSKGPWLGLGLAGLALIAYMLTMQVGLEAQSVAMAQFIKNVLKDITLLPLAYVFAWIGVMIGQPMTNFFSAKFRLAKTLYGAHALRAITLGGMVLLFGTGIVGTGMMSMPLMMAFFLVNGVVTGVATTAEVTLRKKFLADKGITQQSFLTWRQFLFEIFAVPAPMIFGGMVVSLGAHGATYVTALYPITIALGLFLAYILKVFPLKEVLKASDAAAREASAAADVPAAKQGVKASIAKIFANMEEGKSLIMNMPYLKYAFAVAEGFGLMNVLIYRLIAYGYGDMTGGAAGLSAIQGNLVGMFSLGGLLLAIVFLTVENIVKARAKNRPAPDAGADAAAERRSLLRWTMVGIPALIFLGSMAWPLALPLAPVIWLGTNWMPTSLLAAALIPFGFFQVAAAIKANSYTQEHLPHDSTKVLKAQAFLGSATTALSIVMLLALRPLFSAVDAFNPFPWLAAALIPFAMGLFFLQRKLSAATTPEAIAAADRAERKREEDQQNGHPAAEKGGYIGLILGIVTAAVVITALPLIAGIGGLLAGLGVLGKFAVNLALTVLLPMGGFLIDRARRR